MPNQSLPIYGKVNDGASNLLPGVTVNLINKANGEMLPTDKQGLTDDNGEYSINASNLPTSIEDAQGFEVVFSMNNYETFTVPGVFNIGSGGHEIIIDLMREGTKTAHFEEDDFGLKLSQAKVTFQAWANAYSTSGSAEIIKTGNALGRGITDKEIPIINLKPGQVAYVKLMMLRVNTASKNCYIEIVKCSEADGEGDATIMSHHYHEFTGTAIDRGEPLDHDFPLYVRIPYDADTAKSVAMQINGSSASVEVDIGMEGFVLEE